MRDLLPYLDRWQCEGEEIAIATVVRVRGSAPRRPGARLVVTRGGRMAGSVSGGCVESDVYERAQRVLDDGRPVVVTYGAADELGLEVGLACGGSIDVLIEAYAAGDAGDALRRALETRTPTAFCVAVGPDALRGRSLTVAAGSEVVGSIAPKLDAEIAAAAGTLLGGSSSLVIEQPWREETAEIFIEAFPAQSRLFIVGATHTAIPLCRIAKEVGFEVTVIDAREVFATEERFPAADALVRAWPDEAFEKIELTPDCHIVALTHDPKFDLPALALALRSQAGYIGALGSRRTHAHRREQLRAQGFSDAELARIRTPVGLDIGARTPEEVALSIVAEMVALRRGRDGRPLKERSAPIHDDD
ncbi:MAG: XdhC family protein, partial [Deltaproteobacteria bacterium]|nr:XdhC family protein [Deltaproteobacteria bacterium]MBW2666635.1 XdhC family protein [Deltaproteobacteria bacterium]